MKQKYQMPQIEIIHVENEGVMALSAERGPGNYTGGGKITANTARSSSLQSSSSLQDLEDALNDLFTVNK